MDGVQTEMPITGMRHMVRFYRYLDFLADEVADHLARGLQNGDAGIALMRPALATKVSRRLYARGLARVTQNLFILDARKTLDLFVDNGTVDPIRFRGAIEPYLKRCAGVGRSVSAFGEMVALLCEDGHYDAALRLEQLWNELLSEHVGVSLLCAYPMQFFSKREAAQVFRHVCCAHSHVWPTEFSVQGSNPEHSLALAQLEQKTLAFEELSSRHDELLTAFRPAFTPYEAPIDRSRQIGRVLVVHPDRETAESLCEMMSNAGWQARAACSGQAAMDAMGEFIPDMAMINLRLPDADGHSLARRIKEQLGNRPCQLLALGSDGAETSDDSGLFEGSLTGSVLP